MHALIYKITSSQRYNRLPSLTEHEELFCNDRGLKCPMFTGTCVIFRFASTTTAITKVMIDIGEWRPNAIRQ